MHKLSTTLLTAYIAVAVTIPVSGKEFILDVDDASHVRFETGAYASAYQEVSLKDGANLIAVNGSDDYFLTPCKGFLIESVTAFDMNGTQDAEAKKWTYDSSDDSWKIYFLGSQKPAYKYVVKTKADDSPAYALTIDINSASAVKGGTFKVGNQTVTAVDGMQTVEFNPDKGIQFYMQLRSAVEEASFLRNEAAIQPSGITSDGIRTYKFNLSDDERISIDVVMEATDFFLDIDDAERVEVYCPGSMLLTDLKAGRNPLTFAYGDKLTVKAKEGYRITTLDNMSYNPNSEEYTYSFSDGDGGMVFNVETEEYNPPTARFTMNLLNPDLVNYVSAVNNVMEFNAGDTEFSINLDKKNKIEVYYKSKYEGKVMAALDGMPLAVNEYWGGIYSEINGIEEGDHRIVVREIADGDYDGTLKYVSSDDCLVWTLSFSPAGIIEKVEGTAMSAIISSALVSIEASGVETDEDTATITFDGRLVNGSYKLNVPAGLFKINGAASPFISHGFDMVVSGIDGITEDDASVRYFNLQGLEIACPSEGEAVIAVKGNKSRKSIFKQQPQR